MSNTATIEMMRLRGTCAWSPKSKVTSKTKNQFAAIYTFEDTSRLTIYFNGDASWFHRDERGQTSGEQRWPSWHSCNR